MFIDAAARMRPDDHGRFALFDHRGSFDNRAGSKAVAIEYGSLDESAEFREINLPHIFLRMGAATPLRTDIKPQFRLRPATRYAPIRDFYRDGRPQSSVKP